METVFIADDEQNIREGLQYIIDWEAEGFTICGEAANGEDTLRAIRELSPSLVLLDIRMPKMYGTDIIRLAREGGYRGKFIILSGYSDFTYAQTALRYGASFYLTKPIDEDELIPAVRKVRQTILEERSRFQNMALLKTKARSVLLSELITGQYNTDGPSGHPGAAGSTSGGPSNASRLAPPNLDALGLSDDCYQIVIYEKFGLHKEDASYSFADLLKVANRDNHAFEHLTIHGREVILLKGRFALNRFEDFLEHYERLPLQKDSPLDTLFLAYGHPVSSPNDLHLSWKEADMLCSRRFFCTPGQHTLGYDELPNLKNGTRPIGDAMLSEYSSRLLGYILAFNRTKVAESLFSLEEYLYNVKNSISDIRRFLTDLYLDIREKLRHTYSTADIPFPANTEVIEYIRNCPYLYQITSYISEQFSKFMQATGSPNRDSVLDDVLYYIDHNYQQNIKLESIAPLFGYSSSYLGKVFNKTTKESFNSYVDHRRIDAARKLLEEDRLKVYEIAEQVGYKNVDYFHKKFKKYVGVSPAEYRKSLGREDDTPFL